MECSLCNIMFGSVELLGSHIYSIHYLENNEYNCSHLYNIEEKSYNINRSINKIIQKITCLQQNPSNKCVICYENITNRIFQCCKNSVCRNCIYKYIENKINFSNDSNINCFFCRKLLTFIK